jgi:diaminohydroxyphosphoribosylaminopyrimidine deaminase/5-amino-6-(5-phosphoribosylamino)uracil reductase
MTTQPASHPDWTASDYAHMAHALRLAELGLYSTSPNPRVGCVLVRDGIIVGTGWHQKTGEAHAEIHALNEAGTRAHGATAYVTLEPCSHHGRTPPCADALIKAGIHRVITAMQDPNPQVAGQGLTRLNAAGITTECGLLEAQAQELNLGFIQRMRRQRPWLRIKTAASLDGRTALSNGISQWITSADSRHDVHRWRARSCAILTGIGTILADDPRLSVRDVETPRQPMRVIVDSQLRTPMQAAILRETNVLIAYAYAPDSQQQALRTTGAELIALPDNQGQVDLHQLLGLLAQRGINEVLTEAGATLNGALIQAQLADEWIAYTAPILLGNSARGLFNLPAFADLTSPITPEIRDVRHIGSDLRLIARFNWQK